MSAGREYRLHLARDIITINPGYGKLSEQLRVLHYAS